VQVWHRSQTPTRHKRQLSLTVPPQTHPALFRDDTAGMSRVIGNYCLDKVRTFSAPTPPNRMLLKAGDGVVVIGDSLAAGLQAMAAYRDPETKKSKGALPYELEQKGISVNGIAVGGTKAVHWMEGGHLNGALTAALAKKPKAVLISLGSNDMFFARDEPKVFKARMEKIAEQIRAAGASPVFIGPPALPVETTKPAEKARMDAARAAMIEIAADLKYRGVYIPPPAAPIERFRSDPIHPNLAGNRAWAAYLRAHLTAP
jgi:lysophospholipase L1-like esterase